MNFTHCKTENQTIIIYGNGMGIVFVSLDENVKTAAYIFNLNVDTRFRKHRIGSDLIKEAERYAKEELNANVISLSAEKNTFLPDWYKRIGYTPIFSTDNYITLIKNL